MKNKFEQIKDTEGLEAAREYMRNIRAKRKVNKGGGFNSDAVVKRALKVRHAKQETPQTKDSPQD